MRKPAIPLAPLPLAEHGGAVHDLPFAISLPVLYVNADLVEAVGARAGWEPVAHGIAATRMITSDMTEDQERRRIVRARDTAAQAFGRPPQGAVPGGVCWTGMTSG